MIFTWPLNALDLQFPAFSNENVDHLGQKKQNLMPLPCICPSFPLLFSLAPTVSLASFALPATHSPGSQLPSIPPFCPWELLAQRSPGSSHWPQQERVFASSFCRLASTPFSKRSPCVLRSKEGGPLLIVKNFTLDSFPKVQSCHFLLLNGLYSFYLMVFILMMTCMSLNCFLSSPLSIPVPPWSCTLDSPVTSWTFSLGCHL